jgi:hypothetical protein
MPRTLLSCAAISLAAFTISSCGSDDDKADSTTSAAGAASSPSDSTGPTAATTGSSPTASMPTPASSQATEADAGGESPGEVNFTPDPCSLLPAESVAVVLGDPAPAPTTSLEAIPPLNIRQCEWSAKPTELSVRSIFLSVLTTAGLEAGGAGGGEYTAQEQLDGTRAAYAEAVDVPGLGDSSFFTDASMHELQTLVGETLLTISSLKVGSDLEPVTGDQLRTLMETAIASL